MSILASLPITPGAQALEQAQRWLQQQACLHHWPEPIYFAFQLSVDEALNNILQHGFLAPPLPTDSIKLVLHSTQPQQFMIELIDNAPPFDPSRMETSALATDVDSAHIGGHGIRLMRHYLHDIQYAYLQGHNHLYLYARCP